MVSYGGGNVAGRVPGPEMVTVSDCVITVVVLHQDQVYGDCIMGIPETVLEQLFLRRHDQRDVQKAA